MKIALEERERMTLRPEGRPRMLQSWKDLLFLHYPIDPVEISKFIPDGLQLDLFPDESGLEKAWIGVVPFRMEHIRFRGLPQVKWLSDFNETNIRTYVHRNGKDPGVWFFSLDASQWVACRVARQLYHLPYWYAKMSVKRDSGKVIYDSRRVENTGAEAVLSNFRATFGPSIGTATPGTLEHFLVERYLLYSQHEGDLYRARVWHRAYPLRGAVLEEAHESMTAALKIPHYSYKSCLFSDGVDVEVFALEPVE